MACARCGCGVYQTQDVITMNKMWHKCCFTCYKCKCHLDKCTAKICQGEVYCESCYNCMLEECEEVTPCPSRPCRVVSSPSCTCENVVQTCCKPAPCFDYCKKYEVCFPAEEKVHCSKPCQSCSCIPDRHRDPCCKKDPYCFAFPLPREVANYYNREHMKPRKYTSPPNCCPKQEPCCRKKCDNAQVCIKIRTLSPKPPCGSCRSPNRCRPSSPAHDKCCCSKCCPPRRKPCSCCPRPTCRSPKRCTPSRKKPCQPCSPCTPCAPCTPCPPCSPCRSPCKARSPCASRSPCLPCSPCSPCLSCSPSPPCSPCSPCSTCPPQDCCRKPKCCCKCPVREEKNECTCFSGCMPKYCACGSLNPCSCNICQVRALCTAICVRCGYKVYAAERISVTSGAYHTCCFSCYCCHKLLDVKNVYENCGEIYCKQCYNNFFGTQYYGYGSSQVC